MRTYSKSRYFLVLVLTSFIFIIGLLSGIVIESQRIISIDSMQDEYTNNFTSLQAKFNLMRSSNMIDCNIINEDFEVSLKHLEDGRLKLEEYQLSSKISESDFLKLNRQLFLQHINYYILLQDMKNHCDLGVDVLYFFNQKSECPDCEEQQFVLTYFRKKFADKFRVFSINGLNEEQDLAINYLKEKYQINDYPTIVVNGHIIKGIASKAEIEELICDLDEITC